jgi:hypothetical protein
LQYLLIVNSLLSGFLSQRAIENTDNTESLIHGLIL